MACGQEEKGNHGGEDERMKWKGERRESVSVGVIKTASQ